MKKIRSVLVKKMPCTPLGVVKCGERVAILNRIDKKTTSSISLGWSIDGLYFKESSEKVNIETLTGAKEKVRMCERFSISETPNGFIMTYMKKGGLRDKHTLVLARSRDLYEWKVKSEIVVDDFYHTAICYSKQRDAFELFRDGLFIKHQSSSTLSFWREKSTLLFTSRANHFDRGELSLLGSITTKEGILLIYDASISNQSETLLQAGGVLLDKNNPKHILWRGNDVIWQGVVKAKEKTLHIKPFGCVTLGENIILYWKTAEDSLIVAVFPSFIKEIEEFLYPPKVLDRFPGNPIIEPLEKNKWESEGTFNPAVVEDDEGIVHLVYRAVGGEGISRIGYAQSKDGMHFGNRSPYPIFEASRGFGTPDPKKIMGPTSYNPYFYTSGGGWSGAEDPRLVIIGEKVYMMYTAFEGWNSMRIALTSISVEDFKAGKWLWRKPKLISSPENRSKNWILFPEKINGKFAILHSISPKVLIEYIDDLDKFKGVIYSPRPEGPQPGRKNKWDSLLKGSGPPPLRTDLGWLLLYHALDERDTSRYKLGAMILDKNDPSKILYRSRHPILSPDMYYENHGKPGVVYASGAIIKDGELYIYYGGGDRVVCIAKAPLDDFLNYLVTGNSESFNLQKV